MMKKAKKEPEKHSGSSLFYLFLPIKRLPTPG
jgi:hypothetical protein